MDVTVAALAQGVCHKEKQPKSGIGVHVVCPVDALLHAEQHRTIYVVLPYSLNMM